MNKKIVIAVMLSLAFVYFVGCKKKEQQPVPKAPAMGVLPLEHSTYNIMLKESVKNG
ncbi:MAG: hypothetical protein NTW44_06255 [Nitrospirae bacterium]|nr:hypothetical protein [Nitrospirota bacterium]